MKRPYLTHIVAGITIGFGLWLFFGGSSQPPVDSDTDNSNAKQAAIADQSTATEPVPSRSLNQDDNLPTFQIAAQASNQGVPASKLKPVTTPARALNPETVIDDYIAAWRAGDKAALDGLWASIKDCDPCLRRLVDIIVNKSLERGMLLETAIKMAALDTDVVLPVFDTLIDPAGDSSMSIILSEKLVNNGRPAFVTKVFDIIYQAKQNGYDNFARQMTWVISKLDNHDGLLPILDTITGRSATTRDFSDHVSRVFSRVVRRIPGSADVGEIMADYYEAANGEEQQRLWETVSHHQDTLVRLAVDAERNGQNYDVRKYANTIAKLPELEAAEGLLKLHMTMEYTPGYLSGLLDERVKANPTIKVLQKLEDYMRDPAVDQDTRIYAAEALLSVRNNRHARYMLEKVINNPQYADPDLQAYIGGRL
ncbi:MAG: hypothetical protein PVJ39_15760 [Gammaproteobacteria bacterium]